MLEQDEHFKHMSDNPTYIRPDDWQDVDALVDWLIEKNQAGYQMVNSVPRLQEIKAFIRMASGRDLKRLGWNGDGTGANGEIANQVAGLPGLCRMRTASCSSPNGIAKLDKTTSSFERMERLRRVSRCIVVIRLGKHRRAQVRGEATGCDEIDVPAALLFDAESQPGVLL